MMHKILGERIKIIWQKNGITTLNLPIENMSGMVVVRIERGSRDSRLSTIMNLSEILGITMSDLFKDIEKEVHKELIILEETKKIREIYK